MKYYNVSEDNDAPRRAYHRGLFMEALAKRSALNVDAQNGHVFLVGAFSLIERITGDRPEALLRGMNLPRAVWDAFLGKTQNDYFRLLQFVTRYEARDSTLSLAELQTDLDWKQIEGLNQICLNDTDAAIERMDTPV